MRFSRVILKFLESYWCKRFDKFQVCKESHIAARIQLHSLEASCRGNHHAQGASEFWHHGGGRRSNE